MPTKQGAQARLAVSLQLPEEVQPRRVLGASSHHLKPPVIVLTQVAPALSHGCPQHLSQGKEGGAAPAASCEVHMRRAEAAGWVEAARGDPMVGRGR